MMNAPPSRRDRSARRTSTIVLSGIVALAVAMGIGRFSATPLLPLMIRDGTLSVADGAEWAMANYTGYLAGALTAAWLACYPRKCLLIALTGITLSTVILGSGDMAGGRLAGLFLRGAAGMFSAWALVCSSAWFLNLLATRNSSSSGALVFSGVGLGIACIGTLTWLGSEQPAQWLWLELGCIAFAGTFFVLITCNSLEGDGSTSLTRKPEAGSFVEINRYFPFILCYGLFGFGYIIPATFIPVMARNIAPNPFIFGMIWPLFGISAAASVTIVAWKLSHYSRRRIWALSQSFMAFGVMLPLFGKSLWLIAASALLVGGTFMVTTMAGLQLARELEPLNPAPLLARMTAAFAVGQIVGPLLVRIIGIKPWLGHNAFDWTSGLAGLVLAATAAWLWCGPACSRDVQKEQL